MPRLTSCNGCGKKFSALKYRRSHLSQTTDPRCQLERQAFLARNHPDHSLPISPSTSPLLSSSPLPTPTTSILHPFVSSPNAHTQELPEPEDEDSFDATPTSSDDNQTVHLDDTSDEENNDDEHGRFLSVNEATNLQGKIWGDVHIEIYPGRRAGAVYSQGIPTMKEFENILGGPSPNPYAPFNSQTDWELAKWAKFRGPGSTAFTELMGIADVRCFTAIYVLY